MRRENTYKWKNKLHEIINCTFIIHKPQNGMVSVCVCVCVCVHVYVVYEDTNLYNDMGMT